GEIDRHCRAGALHGHRRAIALALLLCRGARFVLGAIIIGLAKGAALADRKRSGGVRIRDVASARDADGQCKEKHRATARDDVRSHGKSPPPKAGEKNSKRWSFPDGERRVELMRP